MQKSFALILFTLATFAAGAQQTFSSVRIVSGSNADAIERRYADLLASRITEWGIPAQIGDVGSIEAASLTVHLGRLESYPELAQIADAVRVTPPRYIDPGPEGFVLASRDTAAGRVVLAIGTDRRGVLYAVGEFLRQMEPRGDMIEFPGDLEVRRAPRWPVRGLIVSQGHTMQQLSGARDWTEAEHQRAYLEFALAGSNTFEIGATDRKTYDFLKLYGLDTLTNINGNSGDGPPEWQAKEAIGRTGYLSPAIPEARARLLELREALFKSMPAHDYVHIKSGDGGGDESEAAAPYGGTFVRLCEDYARILHRHHPNTKVFIGNQKLDNAGDLAIFEYLQEEPREWISGIVYGPGSNAMGWMPGRRQDHRTDLFEYARHGALSGYLRYMLHQLPPQQDILLFTDLTHWVYSQYGLMDHEIIPDRDHMTPPEWDSWMYDRRPDEAMAMVYDRRTFHARPRNYYRVFQETAEFAIGDVAYSEGHHDHFNQWMVQRLFWEPDRSVEDTVLEYARAHFGPEAAPTMAEAIFQLEENLQTPIADNNGVERMGSLVERAGRAMSPQRMERDYLWRQYLQRAYIDRYIRLDVRRQQARYDQLVRRLQNALQRGRLSVELKALDTDLEQAPSRDMDNLLAAAKRLGDESERVYGVRNTGLFNLEHDYFGLGWLLREVERAKAAADETAQRGIIRQAVYYEDPGPGGFYDNAGVPGEAPRLVYGWPYGDGGFSDANRRSQRTMAFTTDEERGVTFRYTGLDPSVSYRVRLTLVRPRYLERFGKFQHQTGQSIYADNIALAENLELPEYQSEFFEFDIPKSATEDGELLLWMKKQPGVGEGLASDISIWRNTGGWGTLVSEVWLMRAGAE